MGEKGSLTPAGKRRLDALHRLSHEIRTPLNAVMGFTQLLLSPAGGSQECRERYLSHLHLATRHLSDVVKSVELLTGTSFHTPRLEPVDVRSVVNEAHNILLPLLISSESSLACGDCEEGAQVFADRLWLRQILLNLITNAVKYGNGRVTVCWSSRQATGGPPALSLSVSDAGAGLNRGDVAQLFEPFNRLAAAATAVEGTGIGLVITRELARGMGGGIKVESAVGVGSTFTVLLRPFPLDQIFADAPLDTDSDTTWGAAGV